MASPGAKTAREFSTSAIVSHLPAQLNKILRSEHLPDIFLFWFAANHLDWPTRLASEFGKKNLQEKIVEIKSDSAFRHTLFSSMVDDFAKPYKINIQKLIEAVQTKDCPTSIVICEMPASRSWMEARYTIARDIKSKDSGAKVTSMRSGKKPAVEYIEGCS